VVIGKQCAGGGCKNGRVRLLASSVLVEDVITIVHGVTIKFSLG